MLIDISLFCIYLFHLLIYFCYSSLQSFNIMAESSRQGRIIKHIYGTVSSVNRLQDFTCKPSSVGQSYDLVTYVPSLLLHYLRFTQMTRSSRRVRFELRLSLLILDCRPLSGLWLESPKACLGDATLS
ncbi:hypothetical protein E2C01_087027 [Portunus trituberculatus]|uniref:Uncharacterized protein n=1 Tax=Portunus trituberculatus TaxID=210409 RepID=A0A5B7J2B9_PORTR|nr:hypothetical protein [Portunus trituberculatus]